MVADGKVFVSASDCIGSHGDLLAYDQKSGKLLYSSGTPDIERGVAIGNDLYFYGRSDSGSLSDVIKVNTANGSELWHSRMRLYFFQTLSADEQFLYVFDDISELRTLRLTDGTLVSSAMKTSNCYHTNTPALGPQGLVYATCSLGANAYQLFAFDTVANKQLWSVSIGSESALALMGTTLYVLNSDTLEARDTSDGKLKWSSLVEPFGATSMGHPHYLLATDNLLLVSGDAGMVAVDIASHKIVWTFPHGGPMSLSSTGVLYLPGKTGGYIDGGYPALVAVNLR
jgi:outer membrane protein assembly factor BamB